MQFVGKVLLARVVALVAAGAPEGCTLVGHLAAPHAGVGKTHARLVLEHRTTTLALNSVNYAHSLPIFISAKYVSQCKQEDTYANNYIV